MILNHLKRMQMYAFKSKEKNGWNGKRDGRYPINLLPSSNRHLNKF